MADDGIGGAWPLRSGRNSRIGLISILEILVNESGLGPFQTEVIYITGRTERPSGRRFLVAVSSPINCRSNYF